MPGYPTKSNSTAQYELICVSVEKKLKSFVLCFDAKRRRGRIIARCGCVRKACLGNARGA